VNKNNWKSPGVHNILIVGTGTIGEPLIGLTTSLRNELGIGNVYFHKRTPLEYEVAKVNSLTRRGAKLTVDGCSKSKFRDLGHEVSCNFEDALANCDIIIDCTPAGNQNKEKTYLPLLKKYPNKMFIAQGSEKGFGVPYAYGINDEALTSDKQSFVQIVSCNTHTIACVVNNLHGLGGVLSGDFVCIRRANDLSQDDGYIASPHVSSHSCSNGTHHAKDVVDLFATKGVAFENKLFSSAMKTNTQYMHVVRFNIKIEGKVSYDKVVESFKKDKMIAMTRHKSANRVFSFGRDHGFYGRIYNQAVVPVSALEVYSDGKNTTVTGFCFTPQDGNSLLSSTAAALYGIHGEKYIFRMAPFYKFLYGEI
jgi:glyceraldehyde-3-phosphate dehydrogenase (NAD(P))